MCGIVGWWKPNGESPDGMAFNGARDRMIHRGPDAAGTWRSVDGQVLLGHRRLAILDLSPAGAQPMRLEARDLTLVFNGEIYNHHQLRERLRGLGHCFVGHSDTEVILAAYAEWGASCLAFLHGMFAFAIWDGRNRSLFIARDRVGEKPLFYRAFSCGFAFASELKALLALPEAPRTLDTEALHHYLAYGSVPGDLCLLSGYKKLPPGCYAVVNEIGSIDVRRYWNLPPAELGPSESPESLVEQLHGLLDASVRRQLEADVPVGILLSGGVDSSLVTALAARSSSRPLHTYTIAFPGAGTLNEASYANLVARHFSTVHTVLPGEAATPDLLDELVYGCDEPMADSSLIPTALVSRLVRRQCTVALGGDGGDELFGGYNHHRAWLRWACRRRLLPGFVPDAVASMAARLPVGVRGRGYMMRLGDNPNSGIFTAPPFFDTVSRSRLLCPKFHRPLVHPEDLRKRAASDRSTPLSRICAADFRTYMVDDVLVKVDRAAMLNSLEVRAPWLDTALVEFAFAKVPDSLKCDGRRTKILPKMLCQRLLPPDLDIERKQGFSIPLAKWMSGEWGDKLREAVTGIPPALMNPNSVRTLITGQDAGRANSERIYALAILSLWMKQFNVTIE